MLADLLGSPLPAREAKAAVSRRCLYRREIALAQSKWQQRGKGLHGRLRFNLSRSCAGLVFGISRAWCWVNCFVPLWNLVGTSVCFFSKAHTWHRGSDPPGTAALRAPRFSGRNVQKWASQSYSVCTWIAVPERGRRVQRVRRLKLEHLEKLFLFSLSLYS